MTTRLRSQHHPMRLIVCVSVVAFLTPLPASRAAGERLPVRTLTTADGLPRDQIACVRPDARGFVWFCTAEGLTRWDGHTAVTFAVGDGLDSPAVWSFLPSSSGRYWVGTDSGLFEFLTTPKAPGPRFEHVPRDDGQRTGAVYALAESRDGSLWCGTGNGLLRLAPHREGRQLREIDIGMSRDTENDVIVRALAEDHEGTLWIGTGSGVYVRRADGRTSRVAMHDGLPDNQVWAIAIGHAGAVWVATRSGLASVARDAVLRSDAPIVRRVYTDRDGLTSANVRSIHVSGATLWIGAVGGVVEAALDGAGGLAIGRSVRGFYPWQVVEDGRGDVWMATEAGARKLTRDGFTTYTEEDGLGGRNGASIFVARGGEVCATILARTLSLACFDGTRFKGEPIAAIRRIRDIGFGSAQLTWQDRRGGWWIPTGEGLLQFAPGPVSSLASAAPIAFYDRRNGLPSNSIVRVFEDSQGQIWVVTWSEAVNGLARIDPDAMRVRAFTAQDGLPHPLPGMYSITESSGRIWIGLSGRRLLRYRDGRFLEIRLNGPETNVAGAPSHEQIRSLLVDRRQQLWLASTLFGVGRIVDSASVSPHVKWYGKEQGLSSNTAWTLVENVDGEIIVGTGRGVDRLNPDTERIVHYSADDGVPRGEILSATRDRAGQIWLATTGGVARLTPDSVRAASPPPTLITGVRVGGVPLPIPADGTTDMPAVSIEPGVRTIEVDYVSPGVREADGVRYQHRLGGDEGWVTTNARTVAFAALAPGSYRLEIRASLASGVVGDAAAAELIVLAPVWQRGWFVALLIAVAVAVAWLLHRTRVDRLLAIQRVRSQIAADLHDGVGARLSRIAVLSEVVRQQAERSLPAAVPTLAAIGDNARDVIDDMSDAVWFVDARFDTLEHVFARARALATELFDAQTLRWTMDVTLPVVHVGLKSEQRRHLYLILKESFTNIVRHAQATQVTVRAVATRGTLRVEISDDGVGLEGSLGRATAGSGRGLDSLRQRAAMLGGSLSIAPADADRGTRIVLDIPFPGLRSQAP
jgi:signal transduction histidine kinase/ligand-binding sensor domain-containing protein